MAAVNTLQQQLTEYKKWRDDLVCAIRDYQTWIEQQGLGGDDGLQTHELIDVLKSDKLTIALVAEFSRGKTELVNAIFFADYRQRLLPSRTGHTTMCPTELSYDEKLPPCIRLLPIETRVSPLTIADYKRLPRYWSYFPLDLDQPGKMAEVFQEIVKTKPVNPDTARELGLYKSGIPESYANLDAHGNVLIPVWRHVLINYPHALLKQGLVILDTPGLNSLGSEPELTLNMIPNAQAVLFVLAADTGVTGTDLEVWRDHVRAGKKGRNNGCYAVLNKIDTLWDELHNADAISANISRQAQKTAQILGIGRDQVFPVSAQKGLISKIKSDSNLLRKSGLLALEIKLSADIISGKQEIVRAKVLREIGGTIESTEALIDARLAAVETQLNELQHLKGQSRESMHAAISRMSTESNGYDEKLQHIQATREIFSEQFRLLFDYLSRERFDALVLRTFRDMRDSWTTAGLKKGMQGFFDGAFDLMEKTDHQVLHIKDIVETAYARNQEVRAPGWINPIHYSMAPYRSDLRCLHHDTEAFRKSASLVMTEQHYVIKKFFSAMVTRARQIFIECNRDARAWNKAIMSPMTAQIREYKIMMDRRLACLEKLNADLDSLDRRIEDMETMKHSLENQRRITRNMLRKIHRSLPLNI